MSSRFLRRKLGEDLLESSLNNLSNNKNKDKNIAKSDKVTQNNNSINKKDEEISEEDEEDDDENSLSNSNFYVIKKSTRINPFAMLNDDDDDDEEEEDSKTENDITQRDSTLDNENNSDSEDENIIRTNKNKKKNKAKSKKKQGRKSKQKINQNIKQEKEKEKNDFKLNEVIEPDEVLLSDLESKIDSLNINEYACLKVDEKKLDPDREMTKQFGAAVVKEQERELKQAADSRLRNLIGQNGVNVLRSKWGGSDGRTIFSLLNRKLILSRIKENWPPHLTKDMKMILLDKPLSLNSNSKADCCFKFVHTEDYEKKQREFFALIHLGDPEVMSDFLSEVAPYNTSTLLLMSDYLQSSNEQLVAMDLIARALFEFNHAFHPRFDLTLGTTRLPTKYYENRCFYLTVLKYIRCLNRRGLYESAFEFSKLILQLSPKTDDYLAGIFISSFAFKCSKYKYLISLADANFMADKQDLYPSILWSAALSQYILIKSDNSLSSTPNDNLHINKNKKSKIIKENNMFEDANYDVDDDPQGRLHLFLYDAIKNFPWVFYELIKVHLSENDIPSTLVQFATPPNLYAQMMLKIYMDMTTDLWSSENGKSLLRFACELFFRKDSEFFETIYLDIAEDYFVETTNTFPYPVTSSLVRNLIRYAIISNQPEIIGMIPRYCYEEVIWDDDPIPPMDTDPSDYEVLQLRYKDLREWANSLST